VILLGNGCITAGTPQSPKEEKTEVDVIFCNPDLLWKNEFEVSRFGQGGVRRAWEGVWKEVKGGREDPPTIQFGKPNTATYLFAKDVLKEVVKDEGLEILAEPIPADHSMVFKTRSRGNASVGPPEKLLNVYMVGDNPDSDICGANRAKWNSILVHTGVFQPHKRPVMNGIPRPFEPQKRPTWEATDVESAVRWAIDEELRRERGERTTREPNVFAR